jgi:hypothetical protein
VTDKKQLTVVTPVATACYAYVHEPRPALNPGGEPQYSITLVFPKTADLSRLKTAAKVAVELKWPKGRPAQLRSPFRDGDTERSDDPIFANSIFVTAKCRDKPQIVDGAVRPLVNPLDFYSGCKCKASLYAFAYDVSANQGVSFILNNLQKISDGDRLSGRRPAAEDFDAVEPEQEEASGAQGTADLF